MTRVTLLTEIPSPYRVPLFNALAERVDLDVLFVHERDPRRAYRSHADELRFRWRSLDGRELVLAGRWLVVNRGVFAALRSAAPQVVVVGGWNQPAYIAALAWAKRRRVPVCVWTESTAAEARSGRLEWAKRALLRRVDACIVPGTAARDYLHGLGVAPERIVVAPNAVDAAIFGGVERGSGREGCRVLAVGRLAPEKGIDVLLRAVDGLPVELVVAGSGAEEARLHRLAGANVRFVGQVDRDDLPALYAEADVLAMPSRSDPWGMVLNEAALAGLPLVSTDAAGAAHDLIVDGENGYRVPAGDVDALREALRELCADGTLRERMGRRSRELAAHFTPAGWADALAGICARLASGLQSRRGSATPGRH